MRVFKMKWIFAFLLMPALAWGQVNGGSGPVSGSGYAPGSCVAPSYFSGGRLRVGIDGDSFEQAFSYNIGTDYVNTSYEDGALGLLNNLMGNPFYWDPVQDNLAQSGGTTTTMLASMPSVLARHPQVVFVGGPHNDALNGIPLSTTRSNLLAIISMIQQCGAKPVLILDPSNNTNEGSSYVTLTQFRNAIIQYNAMDREIAQDQGILTWDWFTPTLNPSDGSVNTSYMSVTSQPHLNYAGAFVVAMQGEKDLATILSSPVTLSLATSPVDSYDATNNIYGNLLTNPLFSSTTAASAPFSGVVPTSWTVNNAMTGTGETVTGSTITPSDGIGNWFQFVVSGPTSGGNNAELVTLTQGVTVTAGSYYEAWDQVNVPANSPFNNLGLKLLCGANSSNAGLQATPGFDNSAGPSVAFTKIMQTPPVLVPVGTTTCTISLRMEWNDVANNFSGTWQVRRPSIRLVPYLPY